MLLGPARVGKTYLGVALVEAAIQAGFGAYFMTAHDLVTDRAYREGRLDLTNASSARYGRGSIILTSNKSCGDWGIIATAILDACRPLHHDQYPWRQLLVQGGSVPTGRRGRGANCPFPLWRSYRTVLAIKGPLRRARPASP